MRMGFMDVMDVVRIYIQNEIHMKRHRHNWQFLAKSGPYYSKLQNKWFGTTFQFVCVCGEVKIVPHKQEKLKGWYEVKQNV